MTLDFSQDTSLNQRRQEPDADYTYGTYKAADSDGQGGVVKGTGTPVRAKERKDADGFRQRLLLAGKITPSGDPDTVQDCEQYDALMEQYGEEWRMNNVSATESTKNDFDYTIQRSSNFQTSTSAGSGASVAQLTNGGVLTSGVAAGDTPTVLCSTEFNISASDVSVTDSSGTPTSTGPFVRWAPSTALDISNLNPVAGAIHGVFLKLVDDDDEWHTIAMSGLSFSSVGDLKLRQAVGVWTGSLKAEPFASAKLLILFNGFYVK